MTDYSKTKIYRLVCKDLQIKQCYIGSTTNFTKRKAQHKYDCNTETSSQYNQKKYQFIRENGGWSEWDIILVEDFPCENNLQARQRERYWSEHFASELNTIRPHVSEEEIKKYKQNYNTKYSVAHSEEKKQYDLTHADKIKERKTTKITCECGAIVNKGDISTHKKTKKHNMYIGKPV